MSSFEEASSVPFKRIKRESIQNDTSLMEHHIVLRALGRE